MSIDRRSFLAAALGAAAGCSDQAAAQAGILVVPAPGGGIAPAAQFDSRGVLHVSSLHKDDLLLRESADLGQSFGEPTRINDKTGFAAGGLFRGPEMAFDGAGTLHVVWYSSASEKPDQGVQYTRRRAGGTFEPSRNLAHEPSDGISVAAQDGTVLVAWHNGEALRLVRSDDAGQAFGATAAFDALPCECCDTALLMAPGGRSLLAYRDRTRDQRDMFVASPASANAPASRTRLDDRSWVIKACPMSGTALVLAGGAALALWERDGRILMSRLSLADLGHPPPVEVGAGKFPIAAVSGASACIAWSEGSSLRWRLVDAATMRIRAEGALRRDSPHRAALAAAPDGRYVLVT